MNVIRGDHVIQHTQAKAFSGLKKPIDPSLTITSQLQEKLPLVRMMRQVPNLSSQIMAVGNWVSYEWRAELREAADNVPNMASQSSALQNIPFQWLNTMLALAMTKSSS